MNSTTTNQAATTLADLYGGNIISTYSRAQALADGVLVAVPEAVASEAGFRWPVAITAAAWADCVAWPQDLDCAAASTTLDQDEDGRLWDVLWMARNAIRQAGPGASRLGFLVRRFPAPPEPFRLGTAALCLLVGPGDQGEPVLTICEPGED